MNKILAGLALLVSIAAVWWSYSSRVRTGYMDIQEVYQKFDLKIDLEKKFKKVSEERKRVTDSLELSLKVMESKLRTMKNIPDAQAQEYNNLRNEFLARAQQFEEDNKSLTNQYDKEILDQLNQYVKDYGKAEGYDFIFGNDGSGSVMHVNEKLNLTPQIIEYINSKYKGVK